MKTHFFPVMVSIFALSFSQATFSRSKVETAKEIANPLTTMTMIPIQINFDKDIGELNGDRTTINVQPLTSFEINNDWDLISRTIIPYISQENVFPVESSESGLGDITQSFFFSPKLSAGETWAWGVGPVVSLPTATEDELGIDHFAGGITAVAVTTDDAWTYGALTYYMESIDNSKTEPDVEYLLVQPFLDYTSEDAITYELTTEAIHDGEDWNIPLIFTANKIIQVSDFMMAFGGGPRYWIESPDTGPQGWSFNLSVYIFLPK